MYGTDSSHEKEGYQQFILFYERAEHIYSNIKDD